MGGKFMLKWSESYEIGINDIDQQHKKFFEIGEKIYSLSKNEYILDKYDNIIDLIDELKDYTKYHFNYEEEFLDRIEYKKRFTHKMTHMKFIDELESIDIRSIDINQEEELLNIMNFVLKWIIEHISNTDTLYAEWYRDNQ